MISTLSERGQVVIPKPLRTQLGLEPGQELDFRIEEGRLVVMRVEPIDPVQAVWGILPSVIEADALLDELRGPADGR